jgi:hypothetical protein
MRRVLLLVFSVIAFAACGGEDELPATRANVQAEVLNKSCNNFQGCHRGASPAGQLDLSDPIVVSELMRPSVGKPDRQLIVPGDTANSYLIDKLRNRNIVGDFMPPTQPLEEDRLSLVERWVAAGAPSD